VTRDTPGTRSAHPRRGSGRSRGRPPGPPRDPVARRGELLDAAERLAAAGTPITIAQVAAEAGYARTAVYAVFPDMPALVDALAERHMSSLLGSANALLARPLPVRELLRDIVALVCDFVDSNPNLHHLMMQRLQSDDAAVCGQRRPFFARLSDWGTVVFEAILEAVGADSTIARVWASATAGAILMSAEDWARTPIRDRGAFVEGLTTFLWPAIESIGADRFVGPLIVPPGIGTAAHEA
jgi:AcrR family transcriptional regulator